jgi:hypothetical protein
MHRFRHRSRVIAGLAIVVAALTSCAVHDDVVAPPAPSSADSSASAPPSAVASASVALGGTRPITDQELAEVRSAEGFAEATAILTEDGEHLRLEAGVTAVDEDDPTAVDITFTPLDADGAPSRKNLELVYQRGASQRPRFYFVTDESQTAAAKGTALPTGPTTQLCIGLWTSWVTTNYTCGYRWLCSKRRWNHQAWFKIEFRSRSCLGGGYQTQVRDVFQHCGC